MQMEEEVKAGVWMSLCEQGVFLVLGTALISLCKTRYSGRWWSDGCARCAAHLGALCSLSCTGSISHR